jgi:hypothetical protein
MDMKYKNELIEYFKVFSKKDINLLSDMFSNNIKLVDWNVSATTKEKVIEQIDIIFCTVNTIQVTPISFYSNSDTSYAVQISILINNKERLDVIDFIEFDNDGLISSINAFKTLAKSS